MWAALLPQRCLAENRRGADVFNQKEAPLAGEQPTVWLFCLGGGWGALPN